MPDLFNALPIPDDRAITSLCLVEDIAGCPVNYTVVSKSHDQDVDADLSKDGFFRKVSRYLCHSKTEGTMGYVLENVKVAIDRDSCPVGYHILEQTFDTNQKAFKKKQLCYKAVPRNMATQSITDVIVLSRSKRAPEGFSFVGELNGLCICYKAGPATAGQGGNNAITQGTSSLPYSVNPSGKRDSVSSVSSSNSVYPQLGPLRRAPAPPLNGCDKSPIHMGSIELPVVPPRHRQPAQPPAFEQYTNTIYSQTQSSLSGVPFILNKRFAGLANGNGFNLPMINPKGKEQLENEYYYSFALEQDILQLPNSC